MLTRKRTLVAGAVALAAVLTLWLLLALNCPNAGIALTPHARALHRLKNRTSIPQPSDFDPKVTLDALLQPGDDTNRWSTGRAARIQGQVVDVAYARPEATNCYSPCRRDIHIVIAQRDGAPQMEQVIVEVTPNIRDWAGSKGIDWTPETLRNQLVKHWCEFEGWLYFDEGHEKESENGSPQQPDNWRATAWEIHPVTRITVLK
jgi:hypothetical protein